MHNLKQNMLQDHEETFVETFEHINFLIQHDQMNEAQILLAKLHYADLADFLDNISYKEYKKIIPLIIDFIKPETLVWIHDSNKQLIVDAIGIERSATLIENLDIEDAIEVIENVDNITKEQLLIHITEQKRFQIIEGFTYKEHTVGRIIEKEYIVFNTTFTVKNAIEHIIKFHDSNSYHTAVVVNSKYRPVGTIVLSVLFNHLNEDVLIKKIMNTEFKFVEVHTDISELVFIFKQYSLTMVPVINKNGKLVGIISIDNMIYIVEEHAEKDIMSLGGVHSQDTFYDLLSTTKNRFPWLFVNLITACITAIIINEFSLTISKVIAIATVMQIVASMGGNAGTQAMTVTVRAISNKDISHINTMRIIKKEILVCGFNGVLLSSIGAILVFVISGFKITLSFIFFISVIINFLLAGFYASVIPISLNKIGIDPGTASGVLLTALTDSLGVFIFLGLCYVFLG